MPSDVADFEEYFRRSLTFLIPQHLGVDFKKRCQGDSACWRAGEVLHLLWLLPHLWPCDPAVSVAVGLIFGAETSWLRLSSLSLVCFFPFSIFFPLLSGKWNELAYFKGTDVHRCKGCFADEEFLYLFFCPFPTLQCSSPPFLLCQCRCGGLKQIQCNLSWRPFSNAGIPTICFIAWLQK